MNVSVTNVHDLFFLSPLSSQPKSERMKLLSFDGDLNPFDARIRRHNEYELNAPKESKRANERLPRKDRKKNEGKCQN